MLIQQLADSTLLIILIMYYFILISLALTQGSFKLSGIQAKSFEANAEKIISALHSGDKLNDMLDLLKKIQIFLAYLLQPRKKKNKLGVDAYTKQIDLYAKVFLRIDLFSSNCYSTFILIHIGYVLLLRQSFWRRNGCEEEIPSSFSTRTFDRETCNGK